jgi:ribokinase
MRILNFGSLNIDHVYRVDHLVRPGETIDSAGYTVFAGGKGNNQSIALARAGAGTWHAGKIGADGTWLRDKLSEAGVDTTHVQEVETPTGHAIIQVDRDGENAIVLHGGANRTVTDADADRILNHFDSGDIVLLQNEISAIPAVMRSAKSRGLSVIFNPAPMHSDVLDYPLDLVDIFIVNETEGRELAGVSDTDNVVDVMRERFPAASTVLTLGDRGVHYAGEDGEHAEDAGTVDVVDTTAAGDTFVGYFLADVADGRPVSDALRTACRAAAICVTRQGAVDAIPVRSELSELANG